MATETQIENGLTARSTYYNTVEGFPFDDRNDKYSKMKHHHYKIDIMVGEKVETFDYYDSTSAYEKWSDGLRNAPNLTENDLILAVGSIFNDAISGMMDLCEFMNEYGYDDCKSAVKTWKACKDTYNRIIHMGSFSEDDLYRIVNLIREKEETM